MLPRTQTEEVPTREEIALRAYQIWEKEGRPPGRDEEHWLLAERELMALYRQEDRALRHWEKSVGIRAKYQRTRRYRS